MDQTAEAGEAIGSGAGSDGMGGQCGEGARRGRGDCGHAGRLQREGGGAGQVSGPGYQRQSDRGCRKAGLTSHQRCDGGVEVGRGGGVPGLDHGCGPADQQQHEAPPWLGRTAGQIGGDTQHDVEAEGYQHAGAERVACPASVGRWLPGQGAGGGERQRGRGGSVAGVDRGCCDGVEAGGVARRGQQDHGDQQQERDRHGSACAVGDGDAGGGETEGEGDRVGGEESDHGAAEAAGDHARRCGRLRGGGLECGDGGSGQQCDRQEERRQGIEREVDGQARRADGDRQAAGGRAQQQRRQAQQGAQAAQDGHDKAAGGGQHVRTDTQQQQGDCVGGQEQEDRITHRRHRITAGRSRGGLSAW